MSELLEFVANAVSRLIYAETHLGPDQPYATRYREVMREFDKLRTTHDFEVRSSERANVISAVKAYMIKPGVNDGCPLDLFLDRLNEGTE